MINETGFKIEIQNLDQKMMLNMDDIKMNREFIKGQQKSLNFVPNNELDLRTLSKIVLLGYLTKNLINSQILINCARENSQ